MNFKKFHPCSRHAANSRSRHAESRRSGKGATLPECVAWRHPCSRHGQAGSDEKFLVAKPLIGMDSEGSGPVQLNWTGPGPDLDRALDRALDRTWTGPGLDPGPVQVWSIHRW